MAETCRSYGFEDWLGDAGMKEVTQAWTDDIVPKAYRSAHYLLNPAGIV